MKKILLAALVLTGLAGCSKNDPDPAPAAPALTGNSWAWTSETTVYTNKSTGAVTNQTKNVVPNSLLVSFTTDGKYSAVVDKSATGTGVASTTNGSYSYSGGTLSITANGKTSTQRVDVLTNSNLTLVETIEDNKTRSVTTDTFAR